MGVSLILILGWAGYSNLPLPPTGNFFLTFLLTVQEDANLSLVLWQLAKLINLCAQTASRFNNFLLKKVTLEINSANVFLTLHITLLLLIVLFLPLLLLFSVLLPLTSSLPRARGGGGAWGGGGTAPLLFFKKNKNIKLRTLHFQIKGIFDGTWTFYWQTSPKHPNLWLVRFDSIS